MEKYLGIDWGEKRIGLAFAEEETNLSLPYETVDNLDGVLKVIQEEEITKIIIGRPNKMTDLSHDLNPLYLKFLSRLQEATALPVIEIDERLSSKEADSMGGPKNMRAGRDEIAAALILQNYLDRYGRK
jgi:putative Holliday junction resolvase